MQSENNKLRKVMGMKSVLVTLDSFDKVRSFVNDMGSISGKAVLCRGRYWINAKSIVGVFSMDLSEPLELRIDNWMEDYAGLLEKYQLFR